MGGGGRLRRGRAAHSSTFSGDKSCEFSRQSSNFNNPYSVLISEVSYLFDVSFKVCVIDIGASISMGIVWSFSDWFRSFQ